MFNSKTSIPILIPALITICLMGCVDDKEHNKHEKPLPNIVFIFADDLGYGDIACFGANDIETPNIDKIANNGIKFNSFYSASPICSPSRAGFLTGRLPIRMGIHDVFFPESFTGMPTEEVTIAEMLKTKNYTTGIIGKWHLGHQFKYLPLQQGFDSYFGIPYSNDMASVVYMRNNDVEEYKVDQHYITKRYTKEALDFIDNNKEKPFFLYLAHNMPHVPIYASEDFVGTSERGLYGDVVQEIDWSVGKIINKLDELNLLENTLVIFSSDNGPWLAMKELGGSAGNLREGKQFTFEGGMRVPTVAMWKNKIPKGLVDEDMASQMDWFPTFANIVGYQIPDSIALDGENISQVLFNTGKRKHSTYLFFDGENDLQAFRNGTWKIKKPYKGNKESPWKKAVEAHDTLLIDLKNDQGERTNLYKNESGKAKELFQEMDKQFKTLGNLPPPLVIKTPADNSHIDYLRKKREAYK